MSTINIPLERPDQFFDIEFLYIFIAGIIGDMIVHFFAYQQSIGNLGFGKSLMPYYNSFRGLPPKMLSGNTKATLYGAISGGIACVVGLIIARVIMLVIQKIEQKELRDKQNM